MLKKTIHLIGAIVLASASQSSGGTGRRQGLMRSIQNAHLSLGSDALTSVISQDLDKNQQRHYDFLKQRELQWLQGDLDEADPTLWARVPDDVTGSSGDSSSDFPEELDAAEPFPSGELDAEEVAAEEEYSHEDFHPEANEKQATYDEEETAEPEEEEASAYEDAEHIEEALWTDGDEGNEHNDANTIYEDHEHESSQEAGDDMEWYDEEVVDQE